jgi:hypothetical protein
MRPIAAGEELLATYGPDFFDDSQDLARREAKVQKEALELENQQAMDGLMLPSTAAYYVISNFHDLPEGDPRRSVAVEVYNRHMDMFPQKQRYITG